MYWTQEALLCANLIFFSQKGVGAAMSKVLICWCLHMNKVGNKLNGTFIFHWAKMFAPLSGPMCWTATRCKVGSALSHLFISTYTKWPFLQCLLINTDWNIKLSKWCQILHGRNNGAEITTTELKLIDTVSWSSFPEAKWSHKVMLHRVTSGILQWYCISCVTFISCGMPHYELCKKLYAFPKAEILY